MTTVLRRGRRVNAAMSALMIFPAAAICLEQAGGRASAFVYDVRGQWTVGGSPVKKGQALTAGSIIKPDVRGDSKDAAAMFVVVMTLDGKPLRADCCQGVPEKHLLKVPAVDQPRSSVTGRLVEAAARVFSHRSDLFTTALARDPGMESRSGIAKLQDGKILTGPDGPQFQRRNVMLLELWLWPQPEAAGSAERAKIVLPVPAGGANEFSAPSGMAAGLYRAQAVGPREGKLAAVGSDFFVLIAGADSFDRIASQFGPGLRLTEEWGQAVPGPAKEDFLQALLIDLAGEERSPGARQ